MPSATMPVPAMLRRQGRLDALLVELDRGLEVLSGAVQASRAYPAAVLPDETSQGLSPEQQRAAAGMMRVNHVGEVCAQALYRGQAMACRDEAARDLLLHAASEEVDHLVWCSRRLEELQSHRSWLNPLWYAGSFALGAMASVAGVQRNLGFMAETERQVEAHLDTHLEDLPASDVRSRSVVQQMKIDEAGHRHSAEQAGAAKLPLLVRLAMRGMSKVMTVTATRI